MSSETSPFGAFLLLAVVFVAYFLPTLISQYRNHPNATSIFLLDLFLGWTFIGWLAALIWSASAIAAKLVQTASVGPAGDRYERIEKLGSLKERGLISEQEYEQEKAKILKS